MRTSRWFIVLALFLLLAIFLPKIGSTSFAKPLFARALSAKTGAKVDIGSLNLSWFGPQKFHQIHWTRNEVQGTIDELQIQAPFWSFSGPFQLTGSIYDGHLSLQGKVYSKEKFDLCLDIKNFPSSAIDPRMDHLFGPTINLNGEISDQKIDLNLASQNVVTSFKGNLTDHSITLRAPFNATIRLTKELCALLLKDANPLFLNGVDTKTPITIQIFPKDFYFPRPFSLEKLVAIGTIDLGQAECEAAKYLSSIVHLLKGSTSQIMNVWFTPISFRIEKGIVDTGRMDALVADSIHICSWGDVDLINDKVHMFLGIPAGTLRKSFGIKNLPPSYVLKIPIRGSTKNPELVKGPALTKIAAMVAGREISKKGFLGGIADLFTNPKDDETIPAAKRPFPWES